MSLGSNRLPHYDIFRYHLQLRDYILNSVLLHDDQQLPPWCINNQLTTELMSL